MKEVDDKKKYVIGYAENNGYVIKKKTKKQKTNFNDFSLPFF